MVILALLAAFNCGVFVGVLKMAQKITRIENRRDERAGYVRYPEDDADAWEFRHPHRAMGLILWMIVSVMSGLYAMLVALWLLLGVPL